MATATMTATVLGAPAMAEEPEDLCIRSRVASGVSERAATPSTVSSVGSGLSPESEHAADDAARMPPMASLCLVLYSTMIVGVNLVIVIPTADDYAHRLGGDQLFGGLTIGALPLLAMIGIGMNQRLLRWLSFKSVLQLLAVGTVIGNILYALAGLMHFKWTLLAARCLIGLCNGFNLPSMYIGLTVGMQRRSEIILYFCALNTLGNALGPTMAAALDVFVKSIRIDNLVLDADTIPGWFMAIVYLLFMVKVILIMDDLPVEVTSPKPLPAASAGDERLPIGACCAAFWHCCVSATVITCVEVYAVNVGQQHWGWSIACSAMFLAALMGVSGVVNLLMGRLTKRHMRSDRAGLMGSSLLGCAACAFLFNFDLHAVSAQASLQGVGLVLVLTLAGLIRALGLAISSKIVPTHMKASMNMWATVFMTLGRGAGGIIGAILSPDSFAPVMLSLFAVTFIVCGVSHRCMKPSEKAN